MRTDFLDIDQKMDELRARFMNRPEVMSDFLERLDYSYIYHDNALEGLVLSYHELKAAIDKNIISDATLIPSYIDVRNHKNAIDFIREFIRKKKVVYGINFFKSLYETLNKDEQIPRNCKSIPPGTQYRRDNPLHRLYFHEICPPDKISYRMRKLIEWLDSDELKEYHPIKRASKAHFKFISIYPWPKHSGKIARLLMNAMLLRDGYVPAIIHAIERQRYYDVLKSPHSGLTTLVIESILGTIDAGHRFLDEVERNNSILVAS